jgi:threonine synthase
MPSGTDRKERRYAVKHQLICVKCGTVQEKEPAYVCSKCGGILRFDTEEEITSGSMMGEGNTPLVPMLRSLEDLDLEHVYVKCEYMNPTGSFKDRGMELALSCAGDLGIEKIIVASAGNASAAAAAYGARAGYPVTAIVPESTSMEKVRQAVSYGAKVIRMKGNYSDSYQGARAVAEDPKWYNLTTTYINPYLWAGYESICRELTEQLERPIDWIMVPIGAGPFLGGIYHGFRKLKEKGVVSRIPGLIGVQSDCCYPIADAYFNNRRTVKEWHMTQGTIASGLNDELKGYTQDGEYTLECIYKSQGRAVIVSDEEILAARSLMGREGLYTEPAGAAGVAAAKKLRAQGILQREDVIVSLATGSGLKSSISNGQQEPPLVDSIEELLSKL